MSKAVLKRKVKKWGNSAGVPVPKELIGEEVEVHANKRYRCKKCKQPAGYTPGIGHFCANPGCKNEGNDYDMEEDELK